MNDIEKLIATTQKKHDEMKSAANFFISTALIINVGVPILLLIGVALAFSFLK